MSSPSGGPAGARGALVRLGASCGGRGRSGALSVWSGTWNVNAQGPSSMMDLPAWLLAPADEPLRHDLYLVAFQEVQPLLPPVTDAAAGQRWAGRVSSVLNARGDHYALVASRQLVGILLLVFLKRCHRKRLGSVYYAYAGTGFMNAGNKGAVAVYLELYNRTLSCVSCHFSAHDENTGLRDQDFHEVVRKAVFSPSNPEAKPLLPTSPPTSSDTFNDICAKVTDFVAGGNVAAMASLDSITMLDSDAVFWLGDLNYRISLPPWQVLKLAESKAWDALVAADQLTMSMSQRASFADFQEGPVKFAPTFKLLPYEEEYERNEEGELKRTPSYTDRILWRTHKRLREDNFVQLKCYERCATLGSDHRPVRALFTLHVRGEL